MKKRFFNVLIVLFAAAANVMGQSCPTTLLTGQNLVTNPDFSQGYTGWTHDPGYTEFTSGNSNPGVIYAGSSAHFFNPGGFTDYNDHTPSPNNDNMMLMVDGLCTVGVKLWSQPNIPISPNTRYYFSLWISSLKNNPNFQGHLQFDINGTNLPASVDAPAAGQTWVQFETFWDSGPTPPATVTISIENTTTSGCATEVDFAIDDINFIPGCSFADAGAQPDLGGNTTLCGKGGSITLDAGIPAGLRTATTQVYWSDGVGGGTGTNPAFYTKTISAPGTYSVCVKQGSSCIKSDVVVISGTFSISLPPAITLCSPSSATLDPGYSGIGVKYKWYKSYPTRAGGNDSSQTFFVNTPGTYRVDVIDPSCGTQSATTTVTSNAAVPSNGTYCSTGSTSSLSVSGAGKYKWFSTFTKGTGTTLAKGASYTTPPLTAPATYTYYVEDTSSTAGTVGPTVNLGGTQNNWGINSTGLQQKIHIYQDVQIMSLKILLMNVSNSTGTFTIEIRDASGNPLLPAQQFTSDPTTITTAQEGTLVQFNFTNFKLLSAWGNDLRMDLVSKTINANATWNQGVTPPYPYLSSPTGIINITGAAGGNATMNDYVHFYDIHFQTGLPCDRVPVVVTHSCPLPIKLIDFTASDLSGNVSLNWSTEEEINNDHFIIQRSSDGVNFSDITSVQGAGTTHSVKTYTYLDRPGAYAILYYRIKQVDINGEYSYSKIASVKNGQSNTSIYPSPLNQGDGLNIKIAGTAGKLKIVIVDVFGRKMHEQDFANINQNATLITDPLNMAKGIYIVEIYVDDKQPSTERIIIQ
jgi:hypothetical protein